MSSESDDTKEEKVINDPVRNIEDNSIFNYDDEYWLKKGMMIKNLLDNEEKRKEVFGDEKRLGFLVFEMYATKTHCCETLLRNLIIAKKDYFRPLIPLVKLNFNKFNDEVKEMSKGIEKYFGDADKFFKDNFYPFPELEEEKVKTSIKVIKEAIKLIIPEYLERGAYNVFKHGFYGSVSKNHTLSMEGKVLVGKAPNMITWYEIEKSEDHHKLNQISKAVSPEREFNIIKLCTSILSQFFKIKRAMLRKDPKVTVSFFLEVDLNKIFSIYDYDVTLSNINFSHEITLPKNFP